MFITLRKVYIDWNPQREKLKHTYKFTANENDSD